MANDSNDASSDGHAAQSHNHSAAQFKHFEWIEADRLAPSQRSLATFLNDARDIVQGTQTLIQLLNWDEGRSSEAARSSDAAPAPLLDAPHRESLLRLLSASLGLLHARIEAQCEALTN